MCNVEIVQKIKNTVCFQLRTMDNYVVFKPPDQQIFTVSKHYK